MADIVGTDVPAGTTSPSPSEFHPASIPTGGMYTAPLELRTFVAAGSSFYRMRAFDTTLLVTVYWNSRSPDILEYNGPGPLTNVVISHHHQGV